MSIDVQKFNDDVWDFICSKVKDAAVFIDEHAAECLHWNGGGMKLINAGASSVREFSQSEIGPHNQDIAVFLTCSPIVGDLYKLMESVIRASNFMSCLAVTGAGKKVHSLAKSLLTESTLNDSSDDPFVVLEAEMKSWMQEKVADSSKMVDAKVVSMPIFAVNFGGEKNHILLTPPFAHIFPAIIPSTQRLQKQAMSYHGKKAYNVNQSQTTSGETKLSKKIQLSMAHMADSLHRLLYKMGGRVEVYAMGHLSSLVAGEVSKRRAESWSNLVSQSGEVGLDASLILVDRTLDLATPCSHGSFALLDRIMATMAHLSGHTTDVAVDMTPLCYPKRPSCKVVGFPPGSLAHNPVIGEKTGAQGELLDLLAGGRRQKEVILGLHRQIMSAAISLRVRSSAPKAERITPKHGLCVSQALSHPTSQMFDYMSGAEKVLLQSLSLEEGKATAASEKSKEILSQVLL
ncbi:hypothetical protein J437_LFUL011481 [Ladona fulva]|uniref:Uncharacterized protein n=1 Tax=Ladona fulva TaxID=123851 RepID=A0A8K0KB22_LADFU|nr:hypothetical protein J437_LFUL011481 [Ladona fulva]